MLFKGRANVVALFAVDTSSGAGKTGLTDISASVSKDGASNSAISGTVTEIGNGLYKVPLTASECTADLVCVSGTSATSGVAVSPVISLTEAQSIPYAVAGNSGGLPTVDSSNRIAGIQGTITDLDGLPTADAIAEQVWTEATGDHTVAGSFGKAVGDGVTAWVTGNTTTPPTADAIAEQVWTEATGDHTVAGSFGKAVGDGVTAWVTATSVEASTVANSAVDSIADGILDRADGVEPASAGTERTVREALRLILSAACGKVSGADGTTITFRDTNDSKARITATVDSDGNRTSVTLVDN